jgi:hypothetical protein
MLVAYLVLIPSGLAAVISILNVIVPQPLLSLGVFCAQLIFVIFGTVLMYRKSEEEKPIEFARKLNVFVEYLRDKIVDTAYNYSLPCVALEIARDNNVFRNTQAWDKLVTKLSEELMNNAIALVKRIEYNGKEFRAYLNEFRQMLDSLQKFKKRFYEMIIEACSLPSLPNLPVFWERPEFKKMYERMSKEYNGYMDRLRSFSDDTKAELRESLNEKLFEYVKGFDELFPEGIHVKL